MKKVVITGVSGLIGGALAYRLLQSGARVYGVGLNITSRDDLIKFTQFMLIETEFSRYDTIAKEIEEDIDVFFHLVWAGGFTQEALRDYRLQLANATEACDATTEAIHLKCQGFIYAGTINEIEIQQFLNDFASFKTRSTCVYATAKLAAELICRTMAQDKGIHYNAGIIPMIYGEGNKSKQLINVVINSLLDRTSPKLIEGDNPYDLVYIDDVVGRLEAIGNARIDGQRYYIGNRVLKTFKELMIQVRDVVNPEVCLRFGEFQDPLNLDYSLIDLESLYRDTGYEGKIDFKENILKTAEWLYKNAKMEKNRGGHLLADTIICYVLLVFIVQGKKS